MPPLTVLLIGDCSRPEFQEAAAALRAECNLVLADDVPQAIARCAAEERWPEVIVLAQDRPGQFSPQAVASLRERWPLARLQALLGPWCEGETRTGRPWPAATRGYWHAWLAAWQRESQRRRTGKLASWALPVTATEDERLLLAAEDPLGPRALQPAIVAIDTADLDAAGCLGGVLQQAGYQPLALTATTGRIRGATAGIWDGRLDLPDGPKRLADFVELLAPAPVLALLNFPRPEHLEASRAAGATGAVAKPYLIEDLLAALRQCIDLSREMVPVQSIAAASTPGD